MARMPMLSGGRLHIIDVDSDDDKRAIGLYFGVAVQGFLDSGDVAWLAPFTDVRINGLPFETDPDAIEDFYTSTDFDFQEVYEP